MTESVRAVRAPVQIGSLTVDGFMLPDGSYRMSQTQAAECVGKPEINARRFWIQRQSKLYWVKVIRPTVLRLNQAPSNFAVKADSTLSRWR